MVSPQSISEQISIGCLVDIYSTCPESTCHCGAYHSEVECSNLIGQKVRGSEGALFSYNNTGSSGCNMNVNINPLILMLFFL